jgi:hypothetical protein
MVHSHTYTYWVVRVACEVLPSRNMHYNLHQRCEEVGNYSVMCSKHLTNQSPQHRIENEALDSEWNFKCAHEQPLFRIDCSPSLLFRLQAPRLFGEVLELRSRLLY